MHIDPNIKDPIIGTGIDPLNFCVIKLQSFHNDKLLLTATAFFYSAIIDDIDHHFLVTNWHVLSGYKADNPAQTMHESLLLPNRIEFKLPTNRAEDATTFDGGILEQGFQFSLYDSEGQAKWIQHKLKNQIDIAALYIGNTLDGFYSRCINDVANTWDMKFSIGNDVFILGYPLELTHFFDCPIWKKGIISSEPHLEMENAQYRVLVDATTRSGMSGSPVIMRYSTHYLNEEDQIIAKPNASRVLGVYASRPAPVTGNNNSLNFHELGYVYKAGYLEEVVREGIKGNEWFD